ncbi:MAG: acyl-CoA carboxylase subunit beta [Christensenellales bacterium]|jgi:acetyl-CoA carboxylase carboxyltransferase component
MSENSTLEMYRETLKKGGGEEAIRSQHDSGSLTARERIGLLLDADSFVETDVFLKGSGAQDIPAEGVVAGFGTIEGRPVYLYAQDYTVLSGSIGAANAKKIEKVINLAMKTGVPVVSLLDSAGARIAEGAAALEAYAGIMNRCAAASGVVPQIAVVCGPCMGAAAIGAQLADFVFVAGKRGAMLSAGPQVLEAAGAAGIGNNAAQANRSSGLVHFGYEDERECFDAVRRFLTYLPDNNLEDPPYAPAYDDMNRTEPRINAYHETRDMRAVIRAVVDDGAFLEASEDFAPSLITGLARLNGRPLGIVANNPASADGAIDGAAADKCARFVTVCDAFNIPILTLVDTPGLPVSADSEKNALIRRCAAMVSAYAKATVPKITVVAGRAIGSGWPLMGGKAAADIVYAWPGAVIAPVEPAAAAVMLYRDEIAAADDAIGARAEYARRYEEQDAGALAAARAGFVDDLFEPESTRPMVAAALEILCTKRENRLPRKHATV